MPPLARTSASPALDCAWCGRRIDEPDPRRRGRRACPACGAQTIDPWPTDAELDEAYAGWYRPAGGRFAGFGDRVLCAARARLAGRVDALAPAGPVLDVGAGDGALLDALRARGREATGLERDANRPDMRAGGVEDVEDGWAAPVADVVGVPDHVQREVASELDHVVGGLVVDEDHLVDDVGWDGGERRVQRPRGVARPRCTGSRPSGPSPV
jgi:hypothetical protein